ncbi:dynein light chain binding [Carpediemonas membranifera]|uniref:Dynein light chain binding n=1 Tax=Carpediemonas membranifera TaxID=201153 RepID=A0A8J6BYG6_9EUKA|nr:dynein light chain binding [Carpediemonas membranifera]|eukprot:KAG9394461.1 dynein light chain binding [Carpediemonas membranifera]
MDLGATLVVSTKLATASPAHRATEKPKNVKSITQSRMIEPKVQVPFETAPGKIPRKIVIERRKREFAALDISELIGDQPVSGQPEGATDYSTMLPLHLFDDTSFEERNPSEWFALGKDDSFFVQTLLDGEWVSAEAVNYRETDNHYLVQLEETRKRLWVPRIMMYILGENPFNFAKRFEYALNSRRDAEANVRYNLFIDSMPNDDIEGLSSENITGISELATNSPALTEFNRKHPGYLRDLVDEIQTKHSRAINKIVFTSYLRSNPDTVAELNLSLVDLKTTPPPAPERGLVPIPPYDFKERLDSLIFNTLLNRSEVVRALDTVRVECNKVINLNVFYTADPVRGTPKPLTLEEFLQTETQAIGTAKGQLAEQWVVYLKNGIKGAISKCGKGWFNLQESSYDVYVVSKLRRLLTLVTLVMQDTTRFLMEASLRRFTAFIVNSCDWRVEITDTAAVDSFHTDNTVDPDTGRPGLYRLRGPLFQVSLQIEEREAAIEAAPAPEAEDEAKGAQPDSTESDADEEAPPEVTPHDYEFTFSPRLPEFVDVTSSIFDKGLSATKGIPQLESQLMENIYWSTQLVVASVTAHEPHVQAMKLEVHRAVSEALAPVWQYQERFEKYIPFLKADPQLEIFEIRRQKLRAEQLMAKVREHEAAIEQVYEQVPERVQVGAFVINVSHVRRFIAARHQTLRDGIAGLIEERARQLADEVTTKFAEIHGNLTHKSRTIEEVSTAREFIGTIPNKLSENEPLVTTTLEYFDTLELCSGLPNDLLKLRWKTFAWPKTITDQIDVTRDALEADEGRFKDSQIAEQDRFRKQVEQLSQQVAQFHVNKDVEKAEEIAEEAEQLQRNLKRSEDKAKLFQTRETLFGLNRTDYDGLTRTIKEFEKYTAFWYTVRDWRRGKTAWIDGPLHEIDAEGTEKKVMDHYRALYKSVKSLKDYPELAKLAEDTRAEVEEFKPVVPLIIALRNPGMRERHWDAISEDIGQPLNPDEDFTIAQALDMGLLEHMEGIQKTCDVASKEFSIEEALDKMQGEWKNIQLDLHAYGETGSFVLKGSDDIQQVLDDHIMMTQGMAFSAFKKPFEERIAKWEQTLSTMGEVLEAWIECQRAWLYLEPIFSSEDIMRQLPTEGKRFRTVDVMWRKQVKMAHQNPHAMTVLAQQSLFDKLQEANASLDLVQKGLSDYLETKRKAFSRFYFLSNDELLEILSQTRDPRAVQPHLRKCFEAIASVKFEEDSQITGMNSLEGEFVPFHQGMYPKGNVENWMSELETTVLSSVYDTLRRAIEEYPTIPRREWVLRWPGQIILAASQVYWARAIEEAITQGPDALEQAYKVLLGQLVELTDVVQGKISKLDMTTLSALLTIDVHARDVTQKIVDQGASSIDDFIWMSQLRYYWTEEEQCEIRMVQTVRVYGNEYLGNSSRLVITPLTDRIYMTLMGAIHLNLGGAPAGPAGTGKTETTKDLAKALAKQCVVFNCSEGLDYLSMGKFFKGLAMSGAWSCFDEFNRIDIEVLSVIAQQILTIQQAIIANAERFIFEGTEISIKPTCGLL